MHWAKHVLPGENAIELNDGRALTTIISSSRPDQRWRSTKSMGLVRSETPFRFAMSITQKEHADKWEHSA